MIILFKSIGYSLFVPAILIMLQAVSQRTRTAVNPRSAIVLSQLKYRSDGHRRAKCDVLVVPGVRPIPERRNHSVTDETVTVKAFAARDQ